MPRRATEPTEAPPATEGDFVSQALSAALNVNLETMQAHIHRVAEAEKDRAEAMAILRKVGRKGKRSKHTQRAPTREPRDWKPVFLAALRMIPNVRMACDAACVCPRNAVQDNYVRRTVRLPGLTAGAHVFKIWAVDPGAVIDRLSLLRADLSRQSLQGETSRAISQVRTAQQEAALPWSAANPKYGAERELRYYLSLG